MSKKHLLILLFAIFSATQITAQSDYYYDDKGTKIPITLNENKVLASIPQNCDLVSERIRENVQALYSTADGSFNFFFITRSDLEKLTSLDFWKEDSKSVIITPSYFTENNAEVYTTPYLIVKLKKEEDIDLLTSYTEKYKLKVSRHYSSDFLRLVYILNVTLESEKSSLECANEMYESGNFASSVPDFALAGSGAFDPAIVQSITNAKTEESSEVYDLLGRKQASRPIGGIYIHRGQKVLVK